MKLCFLFLLFLLSLPFNLFLLSFMSFRVVSVFVLISWFYMYININIYINLYIHINFCEKSNCTLYFSFS